MEFLVLDNYLKEKNKNKKTFIEIFKFYNKVELILLFIMIMSSVISIVLLFEEKENVALYFCILLEIGSVSILYFIQRRKDIERIGQRVENMDKIYENDIKWLNSIGFKEKNQIKQLCKRCEIKMEENKKEEEKFRNFIDKVFSLFLIPIYATIVTMVVKLNSDIIDIMLSLIVVGIAGVILYILAFGLMNLLIPFFNREYVEMDKMVRELYWALDRAFEISETDIV